MPKAILIFFLCFGWKIELIDIVQLYYKPSRMQSYSTGLPQRKRLKTYNKKKIVLGFLITLVALIVVIHFGIKMRRAYLYSKEIQAKKNLTLQELETKSKQLEDQLQLYESPVGQERLLRERYSMVKDGEHEIIIEEGQKKSDENNKKDAGGLWQRLVRLFKKD